MAIQNHHVRAIRAAALILAGLAPFAIILKTMDSNLPMNAELIGIYLWIVSPIVIAFVVAELLERFTSIKHIHQVTCAVAVVMLMFSVWAYSSALDDTSSTSGLIFIFGPFWLYVVALFSLGLFLLFARSFSAEPNNTSKSL